MTDPPPTQDEVSAPVRPCRTLTEEQVTHMRRLQTWARLSGDKPGLREWLRQGERT
jgi:hypothetical protein